MAAIVAEPTLPPSQHPRRCDRDGKLKNNAHSRQPCDIDCEATWAYPR